MAGKKNPQYHLLLRKKKKSNNNEESYDRNIFYVYFPL